MSKFNFSNITNSQDILNISGLDFTVNKYPVISNNIQSNEYFGLVSSNNDFFGIAGKNYQLIQNSEFFSLVDILTAQNFKVTDAYQFKSKSIIKLTLDQKFKVNNVGDLFAVHIFISNDFSGKHAGEYSIYLERLACKNGLKRNKKESSESVKHFRTFEEKLKIVETMCLNISDHLHTLDSNIQIMNESYLSDTKFNDYINTILGIDDTKEVKTRLQNQKNEIISLYNNKPDLVNLNKSYYRAFNAVSDYYSHKNYKNSKDNNLILETSLVYNNDLSNAFELALELSQN